MKRFLGFFAAIGFIVAANQLFAAPPYPYSAPTNLSAYAKTSDVNAAISAAVASLASQSQLTTMQNSLQALIPSPASTVPGMEIVGGSAGSAGTFRRGDAIQPRISRSKTVTLDATGAATFDWTSQGALASTGQVIATPVYTGANAPTCWATSVSTTAVSIKCKMGGTVSITLAALTAAAALGLTLDPFSGSVSGMSVGVIVLPTS